MVQLQIIRYNLVCHGGKLFYLQNFIFLTNGNYIALFPGRSFPVSDCVSAVYDWAILWTFFHHLSRQFNKTVINSCHIYMCDRVAVLDIKACGLSDDVNKVIKLQ